MNGINLRCPVDNRWFEAADPVTFCSDRCRKSREKQIDRAIRDLATGTERGEAAELLADAECLWALWFARGGDDLVHTYWSGMRPTSRQRPEEPQVAAALSTRIARLREVVRAQDRRAREQQRQKAVRRVTVRDQSAQDEADRAWRTALLSGTGMGSN